MDKGIHFISGLPRSGSTLLAAILRQNPRFHAGISSPVASLVLPLQRQMSQENETATFIDDGQREAILRGVFDAYYARVHPTKLVFDTNRAWCAKLPLLDTLFPGARVVACVRDVSWIMDSFERLIRRNTLELSRIFNFDPGASVYNRIDMLCGNGMVGFSLNALRDAFYGERSDTIMILTYETLTREPARALKAVYGFLGEPPFAHDFETIAFDAEQFDRRLGTPGLHRVGRRVESIERQTILPPDLFGRFAGDAFWRDPATNPRGVRVV